MQASATPGEPRPQRVVGRERFDELQVRVPQVEMREPDGAVVHNFAEQHRQPHAVTPDFERLFRVRDDDRNVVERTKDRMIHLPYSLLNRNSYAPASKSHPAPQSRSSPVSRIVAATPAGMPKWSWTVISRSSRHRDQTTTANDRRLCDRGALVRARQTARARTNYAQVSHDACDGHSRGAVLAGTDAGRRSSCLMPVSTCRPTWRPFSEFRLSDR
jgi:hypothetical protein